MHEIRKAAGLSCWRFARIIAKMEIRLLCEHMFHPARFKEISEKVDAIPDEEAFEIAVEALRQRA